MTRAESWPRAWWRRFWARAPRQLRFTRAGRVLVGLALAVGFAAINTGNNLLFLGWGLVLSAIVVSGTLSEGVLRNLQAAAAPPSHPRARVPALVPISVGNRSRYLPGFALDVAAIVTGPHESGRAVAPFVLRLAPAESRELAARYTPMARGLHRLEFLRVKTTYPFGFFAKSRRFTTRDVDFWVAPPSVPVDALAMRLEASLGESPRSQVGPGEDFFSLRPFRSADDVRRVHWRRSAKTGRWVVRETEAVARQAVLIELALAAGDGDADSELAIATAGSLAEKLLEHGRSVGLLGPGVFVPVAAGEAQCWDLLAALARLEPAAPPPPSYLPYDVARIVVATGHARVPAHAQQVLTIGEGRPRAASSGAAAGPAMSASVA
jgi:uncharacterized protein (DUF58 family)